MSVIMLVEFNSQGGTKMINKDKYFFEKSLDILQNECYYACRI
nr:MAG TPA: hypothetical protein [Caudoviricetes sp.]